MIAKYAVRQSQLISTWGIGQIIPFPEGDLLMIAGLDAWQSYCYKGANVNINEFKISDVRLARRLGVTHFRKPPDHREPIKDKYNPNINTNLRIPAIRFPKWHYCPACGYMKELPLYASKIDNCPKCNKNERRRSTKLIPIYFVAVCKEGHIEDFPFFEWVHDNKPHAPSCELKIETGLKIKVICSCGVEKSMSKIYQDNALSPIKACSGKRPWLGEIDSTEQKCGKRLKVLQIGASNVYFPITVSSLFLPRYDENASDEVLKIITKKWSTIEEQLKATSVDQLCELLGGIYGFPAERFKLGIIDFRRGLNEKECITEEDYRYQEYQAIINLEGKPTADFYTKEYPIDSYEPIMKILFSRIICIPKLRETRAFAGFSRILPCEVDDYHPYRANLMLDNKIDWLPAYENHGEGIFLELHAERLENWLSQKTVQMRFNKMHEHFNKERSKRKLGKSALDPRFVLLHTFAHIFIRQLAFVSGYNIASIRERLYWGAAKTNTEMNGILLYTASSDSEGSLGGLVNQGRPGNFEPILHSALQAASWCSADPICIESKGQGVDGSNLAACHNCALLPETSCEKGNRLLDRGMIIGSAVENIGGFFTL